MDSNAWPFSYEAPARRAVSTILQKHAEVLEAEELARTEKRRVAIAELKTGFASASERVSAWEKLHGLRLPSDAMHSILPVIARSTGLTLAEVRDEQRVRQERRSGTPGTP